MSDSAISKDAIVIERTFDVPVDVIWQMWTEPEHFKNWYGPKGFTVPVAKMDVRVGGKYLVCMEASDGSMKLWFVGEYMDVIPNKRLVYTDSMADENGNMIPSSMQGINDSDHPLITEVTVLLEDLGGRTKMVMTHSGMPAGEQGAKEAWEQAFANMADYIETALNNK